jgi:ArsR family transcriptional regulator
VTQISKQFALTPLAASSCCGSIDSLLDPGLFKALCDPTRLRLVACIAKCGRGCAVGEIAECCAVDLSVVSRHLRTLEQAGVLAMTKRGRTVFYAVRYQRLAGLLRAMADAIDECCPSTCRTSGVEGVSPEC